MKLARVCTPALVHAHAPPVSAHTCGRGAREEIRTTRNTQQDFLASRAFSTLLAGLMAVLRGREAAGSLCSAIC